MPESLLTVLKFCLLALVYLFLARIVRVVVLELRAEKVPTGPVGPPAPTAARAPGCSVVFTDDTFISQVHARVFRRSRDFWVEDLGSTNGTMVNGARIDQPTRVRPGDTIQFGQTVTRVVR